MFKAAASEGSFQCRKVYVAIPPLAPIQTCAYVAIDSSSLLPENKRAASRAPRFTIILLVSAACRIEELSSTFWILNEEVR